MRVRPQLGGWASGQVARTKAKPPRHTITPATAASIQGGTSRLLGQSIGGKVVFEYSICFSLGLKLAVLSLGHTRSHQPDRAKQAPRAILKVNFSILKTNQRHTAGAAACCPTSSPPAASCCDPWQPHWPGRHPAVAPPACSRSATDCLPCCLQCCRGQHASAQPASSRGSTCLPAERRQDGTRSSSSSFRCNIRYALACSYSSWVGYGNTPSPAVGCCRAAAWRRVWSSRQQQTQVGHQIKAPGQGAGGQRPAVLPSMLLATCWCCTCRQSPHTARHP